MAVDLSRLDSFGDVAAEDDEVLRYFLETEALEKLGDKGKYLVVGRKGAGKTALVRYMTERGGDSNRPLNLRGYPWNVHSKIKNAGAGDSDVYTSSWKYLIAVEFASMVMSQATWGDDEQESLKRFLEDNYGSVNPEAKRVFSPKRLDLKTLSFSPQILGSKLFSVDFDKSQDDPEIGSQIDALANAILDASCRIAERHQIGDMVLHFDELDQGMHSLQDDRKLMLVGLVLAAKEVLNHVKANGIGFKPLVYLRTDIWDSLKFSDKNKISRTNKYELEWKSQGLKELVNERIRFKLGDDSLSWEDVTDKSIMRGSQQKWDYVVTRTLLRPRDVIHFLNLSLSVAKERENGENLIGKQDVYDAKNDYSYYLKEELDDEMLPHWEDWEDYLNILTAVNTETFNKDDFESQLPEASPYSVDDVLEKLYNFSVIGYDSRLPRGGAEWVFRYSHRKRFDSLAGRFKVHPGLKEFAKLREERSVR